MRFLLGVTDVNLLVYYSPHSNKKSPHTAEVLIDWTTLGGESYSTFQSRMHYDSAHNSVFRSGSDTKATHYSRWSPQHAVSTREHMPRRDLARASTKFREVQGPFLRLLVGSWNVVGYPSYKWGYKPGYKWY